jgi:hypothetical protein
VAGLVASRDNRVRLDLNNPEFQEVFLALEVAEWKQVSAALRRLRGLNWNSVYMHGGLNWEAVNHVKAPNGSQVYSLRLSRKVRALAYRDGNILRFLSLHLDHDSAYER